LKAKGFFCSPPPPILDESKGTVAFQMWPESRYLARMADLAPATVLDILLQIPDTENIRIHNDLADAALAMPAEIAARILPKATKWIKSPYQLLMPEKLGALISHLVKGGQPGPALDLAKALLAIRPDPRLNKKAIDENSLLFPAPQPLFDLWHYEQIVQKNVPDLVTAVGEPALAFLCDLLDEAENLSRRGNEEPKPEDYSNIWRRSLDRGQSTDHDVRGILVSAVRDAAEQLGRLNPAKVTGIVRDLEMRSWHVFRRMALHVLRLFGDASPDLVAERLTKPERYDKPDFRREYYTGAHN
jgi:hypothetical protein